MNPKINLNELSKEDLIQILISQIQSNTTKNEIKFFDLRITTNENLKSCERTLNRILRTNKPYWDRQQVKRNDNILVTKGYVGEQDD